MRMAQPAQSTLLQGFSPKLKNNASCTEHTQSWCPRAEPFYSKRIVVFTSINAPISRRTADSSHRDTLPVVTGHSPNRSTVLIYNTYIRGGNVGTILAKGTARNLTRPHDNATKISKSRPTKIKTSNSTIQTEYQHSKDEEGTSHRAVAPTPPYLNSERVDTARIINQTKRESIQQFSTTTYIYIYYMYKPPRGRRIGMCLSS